MASPKLLKISKIKKTPAIHKTVARIWKMKAYAPKQEKNTKQQQFQTFGK